ncbi:hypothetical protein E6R60_00870 [Streptomyces sp. A0642]|nr:hypothetical protein E6R60_00870 [Streptomyces sp. A0642]
MRAAASRRRRSLSLVRVKTGYCGEVTDSRHSFESTRRGRRPANSFMVSVTAPGGAGLVY